MRANTGLAPTVNLPLWLPLAKIRSVLYKGQAPGPAPTNPEGKPLTSRRIILLLLTLIVSANAVPLHSVEVVGGELPELATLALGAEYDAVVVDATLSKAAARLAGDGFFDARLLPELRQSEGGYRLLVRVEAGERYALGELTINGASALSPTTVEAVARAAWRRNGLAGLTSAVEELYA